MTPSEHLDFIVNKDIIHVHILQSLGKAKMVLKNIFHVLLCSELEFFTSEVFIAQNYLVLRNFSWFMFFPYISMFSGQLVLYISVFLCVCVTPGDKKYNSSNSR